MIILYSQAESESVKSQTSIRKKFGNYKVNKSLSKNELERYTIQPEDSIKEELEEFDEQSNNS